ncbi:OmpH family outer membrane protein [Mucilaginibacter mali]|uniref:OmpH family outer membrane protein n=1 Tax=Mucilaginibacter mali TaxID=2740462 RepID=A0A7D4Q6C2_9SPHI|nr:OmpH family outer membrane protein [Mucilaginibacter mali]QKJ29111.1 OmpH family outer membrane protein [Mucilaginibacter mali]
MKNLVKSALVAACVLVLSSYAKAQTKIGYLNFQNVVTADPEFAKVTTQINAYQQQFVETIKGINTEYQTKLDEYNAKRATMTDAQRTKAESELTDLQKRLNDQNTNAQNLVNQKYGELTKPLVDKWKAAVNQLAKEKGYTYVIDSSQVELLVAPDGDNLEAAVKAKGGVTAAPAATKPAGGPVKK